MNRDDCRRHGPRFVSCRVFINPNPDKASFSESLRGQAARRVGAAIAEPMVSGRNAADGGPAVRPQDAPQGARLRVELIDKGATIVCGARLDSDPLWDSECGFVGVRVSNRIEKRACADIVREIMV